LRDAGHSYDLQFAVKKEFKWSVELLAGISKSEVAIAG